MTTLWSSLKQGRPSPAYGGGGHTARLHGAVARLPLPARDTVLVLTMCIRWEDLIPHAYVTGLWLYSTMHCAPL